MRIAVACSGLGHVQRGIEAWAESLALGLHASGEDVMLFHGGGQYPCRNVELSFVQRDHSLLRWLERTAPKVTWRWGWKSSYVLEQKSFARALLSGPDIRSCDVIHTQDVVVATILERERARGRLTAPTILAHGTDERPEVLARFAYVQHLSPENARCGKEALSANVQRSTFNVQRPTLDVCIPNFVDTTRFRPPEKDSSCSTFNVQRSTPTGLRVKLGIPHDAFVIGGSAALRTGHKRMDVLIREVAGLLEHVQHSTFNVQRDPSSVVRCPSSVYLLLAGAETTETPEVERLADKLLGEHCRILQDLPFDAMPDFYRALDLFVHPALEEVFGICFLEAMACGVPVVSHDQPTGRWIAGEGGWCVDMAEEGFLARTWPRILAEIEARKEAARSHVEAQFSWDAVYPQFMEMYRRVLEVNGGSGGVQNVECVRRRTTEDGRRKREEHAPA